MKKNRKTTIYQLEKQKQAKKNQIKKLQNDQKSYE